jgi:hypothetical protein
VCGVNGNGLLERARNSLEGALNDVVRVASR